MVVNETVKQFPATLEEFWLIPTSIVLDHLLQTVHLRALCNLVFRGFDKLVDKGLSEYCRSMSID